MNIALFGKSFDEGQIPYLQMLIDELCSCNVGIVFYKPYFSRFQNYIAISTDYTFFETHEELTQKADILFSIGGDGTLLDTIPFVRDTGIPILGINLGRMGFLSSISKDEIKEAVENVLNSEYDLDKRALLSLESPKGIFGDLNYALNDLTISRNNTTSLIDVHVYVDGLFLNSYWGDGLIVSTPTGSTAYSLAAGGPILSPGSQNFIVVPIASHNLTVRPIVIQDSSEIKIRIEGREEKYLMTMDSRQSAIHKKDELIIKRCKFEINLVQMRNKDFYSTVREKLLWGRDYRN